MGTFTMVCALGVFGMVPAALLEGWSLTAWLRERGWLPAKRGKIEPLSRLGLVVGQHGERWEPILRRLPGLDIWDDRRQSGWYASDGENAWWGADEADLLSKIEKKSA